MKAASFNEGTTGDSGTEDVCDATVSSSHGGDSTRGGYMCLETKPSGNWKKKELEGQGIEGCSSCVCRQSVSPVLIGILPPHKS